MVLSSQSFPNFIRANFLRAFINADKQLLASESIINLARVSSYHSFGDSNTKCVQNVIVKCPIPSLTVKKCKRTRDLIRFYGSSPHSVRTCSASRDSSENEHRPRSRPISRAQPKQRTYYSEMTWLERSSGKSRSTTLSRSLFDIMNQPLTVCVEGNIGSGKTTFLEHFKKFPEVCVFDEPISKWRDCQGFNLLDLMYKDPKKWSMCFQSYVQLTMLDLHTKSVEQPIKMMERSIYSAQYCFVKNLRDSGLLEEAQFAVLSEWFSFATKNIPMKLDLIVYLRTDPEVAFARTNQRGRSEENSISLDYLRSVHDLHEDWLVTKKHLLPCPVLTIDANLGLEKMAENYDVCRKNMFQKVAVI